MVKYSGRFSIKIENAVTGQVREHKAQENLILNSFFGVNGYTNTVRSLSCLFGSGSTPPQVTDTGLESRLNPPAGRARTIADYLGDAIATSYRVGDVFHREVTVPLVADQGAITGNISEIGLATGYRESEMFTRAILKDELGNPTTISVGANDIITVVYTIGYTIDLSSPVADTITIDVNGTPTTVSFTWIDYDIGVDKPYGLWDQSSTIRYTSNKPFYPATFARYLVPYSGTFTDPGSATSSLELLGTATTDGSFNYAYKDGIKIGRIRENQTFSEGSYTGTWNGLILGNGGNLKQSAACVALVFDPPIEKSDSDVITIDRLLVASLRGA